MTARSASKYAPEITDRLLKDRAAVRSLTLTQFRNYPALKIDISSEPVVLTGPNGAGKTNILEALSLLAPGRGTRNAKLEEIDCHHAPSIQRWAVHTLVDGMGGKTEIGTGHIDAEHQGVRRAVKIDGKKTRQAALAEKLSVLWITPQMDGVFLESDSARRKFIDRLAYGLRPEHAQHISAYEQASRERMKLLEDGIADDAWLTGLEQEMSEHATHMAITRRQTVEALNASMQSLAPSFPRGILKTSGMLEEWIEANTPAEMAALAAQRLRHSRHRDAAAGRVSEGLHRTVLDAELSLPATDRLKNARECSTGEQKALLLSVILAGCNAIQKQRGLLPVLLLDEVVAHLDGKRRTALFEVICKLGIQAWMTGTDRALFSGIETYAQCFDVREGRLAR